MTLLKSLSQLSFRIASVVYNASIEKVAELVDDQDNNLIDDLGNKIVVSLERTKALRFDANSMFSMADGGGSAQRDVGFLVIHPSPFVNGEQVNTTSGPGRITNVEPSDNSYFDRITVRLHTGGNR